MEDIILSRLSAVTAQLTTLKEEALSCMSHQFESNMDKGEIISAKLETSINRFTTELHNYLRLSQHPSADDISNFSMVQLAAEEVLAELKVKLKKRNMNSEENPQRNMMISRLPELGIVEFGGNLLEWTTFWDQFSSKIDKRNITNVEKLMYLKGALKGEARKAIDGLETTNNNYSIALSILKERYGKVSVTIDAHYSALYKIKPSDKTITDCRRTLDEIERHLRILSSLGEDTNHNHLRFLIMERFPEDIVYEMKMNLKSLGTESIEEMRKQLAIIISAREDSNRARQEKEQENYTVETLHVRESQNVHRYNKTKNHSSFSRTFKDGKGYKNFRPNTSSNFKGGSVTSKRKYEQKGGESDRNVLSNKRRKLVCIFCQESHFNDECSKCKTLVDRKSVLKNRCYNCLQEGHNAFRCKAKRSCVHCGKYGEHNRALCPKKFTQKMEHTNILHVKRKGSSTALQTATVNVEGTDHVVKCRILLDSGSQRSYVTQQIAKKLKLPVEEVNYLSVFTFGSKAPQELESPLVKIKLMTRTNNFKTIYVNVVPTISEGIPCPEPELSGLNPKDRHMLADDGSLSNNIDVLIGNDYYYSLMSTKKVQIREDLYLVESELGWLLSGKIDCEPLDQLSAITYFQSSCEIRLNQPDPPLDSGNLTFLWDLESIGIKDSPKINRDEEAIQQFNENTKFCNNRYQVCWPWNEYKPNLPTNFGLAYGRLVNLLKRLDKTTLSLYDQTIRDQLEKGIIEIVPDQIETDRPIHYIPHHGVTAPGKTIRIVYDASAKTKENKNLNECLYCGPMMIEDLTGLLIKFRCHPIGLTADVEKAFLQIGLQKRDRDVTRFLWLKNTAQPATKDNILHLRFTRVPFGIISSPFILNATIKHHLSKSEDNNIKKLANDIYVDNLVSGMSSTQEAIELYGKLKKSFQEISMNLREWSSNPKEFMRHIPDPCQDKIVKVLGLNWNTEEDTLHLKSNMINSTNTKRGILKSVASIYDPCGYTVPTLLPAKVLLQDLWKIKIKWDTPMSKEFSDRWLEIKNYLIEEVKEICLDRYYMKDPKCKDCEIHCFTDASSKAYAAVVYIVNRECKRFVIGKSRLVPIKDQIDLKIPRLELLGVLIGSRLIQYVHKFLQFNVTKQILWTDSQIVIDWYNSNKLLTPFVSRRMEEIKRNKYLTLRYVPSEINPADVATRPTSVKADRQRWLAGPDFLLKEPSEWPKGPSREVSLLIGEDLSNNCEPSETIQLDSTPSLKDQNVQKDLCQNVLSQTQNNAPQEIKKIQAEYFTDEVNGKITSLSRNLQLFKDIDGILRCQGRLKNALWSFDKKYPILIPKECEFTNNIIKDTHEKNYHVGANHTLSIIRQCYWIPQGKSQVQKVLRKCPTCVKHGGGPFKLPSTPALPPERVNYSKPFTFTGLDYLGPVLVSTNEGTSKRWICLFTCLAVRAIHLEVVQDLSAEEGLLALRRMVSTRGIPTLITSDNALHFKLISDVLSNSYCIDNKIRWRFIPELAPWFGGFYERLVGMVKHCMKRTLQKHLLKDGQLATVTKEIESVLNTRPLTYVDPEIGHILKPSDFLSLGECITGCDITYNKEKITSTKQNLIESWKKGQIILEEFKSMFINRYLSSLRERYQHSHKQPRIKSQQEPKVGDCVQIKGDSKNRETWRVGKIIQLLKGSDGLCRVARVQVGKQEFTRSIAQLYPLEMEETEHLSNSHELPISMVRAVDKPRSVKLTVTPEVCLDETVNQTKEVTTRIDERENITDEASTTDYDNINMTNNINMTDRGNSEDDESVTAVEQVAEVTPMEHRQKRGAAVRALEKIREWTRNLMISLL